MKKIDIHKPRWWLGPLCAVALILFLIYAPGAGAQGVSFSDLPTIQDFQNASNTTPIDASRKILTGILGVEDLENALVSAAGMPSTPLQSIFFVLNSLIFIVAGIYMVFRFISAIAVTAESGKYAGGDMESGGSVWRWIVGIFGLVPAFSGYTLAQTCLIWMLSLGIGAANLARDHAVDMIANAQFLPQPAPSVEGAAAPATIDEIANAAAAFALCKGLRDERNGRIIDGEYPESIDLAADYVGLQKGWTTGREAARWNGCGSVQVAIREEAADDLHDGDQGAVMYSEIAERTRVATLTALNQIGDGVPRIVAQHYNNLSIERGTTPSEDDVNALLADIHAFSEQIKTSMRAELTQALPPGDADQQRAIRMIKDGGWMMSPMIYQVRAETEATIMSALNAYSLVVEPAADLKSIVSGAQNDLRARTIQQFLVQKEQQEKTGKWFCPVDETSSGACSVGQSILKSIAGIATDDSGRVDPILASKKIGDFAMIAGQAALVAGNLDTIAAVVPGAGFIAKTAISTFMSGSGLGPILNTVGWFLLGIGMILAIYIPLLPFIVWTSAVIAWIFSVFETLVQSGLWMLAHLYPHPKDGAVILHGSAARGYATAMNLVLRPVLMVLGFFLASAGIVYIGSWFFDAYFRIVGSIQGSSTTGLMSIVGYLLILSLIIFGLVQTVFSLCVIEIPNRILGALGTNDSTPTAAVSAAAAIGVATGAASLGRGATRAAASSSIKKE